MAPSAYAPRVRRSSVLLIFGALTLCGCGPGEDPEPAPRVVVDHSRWERVEGAADPFRDEPEAAGGCDDTAYGDEPPFFEVDTGLCAHVTFAQPLLEPLLPGELVKVIGWHLALFAPEAAEGHMAVHVGELPVLEYRVPIPSPEAALEALVAVDEEVPAGTDVYLHVHNHGDNTWKLLEVSAGPPEAF